MDQVLGFFLVVFVVVLVLSSVRRRGSWRSFEREFHSVYFQLLEKSTHPNCLARAEDIGVILCMLTQLADAGDKAVRRVIGRRRWLRLLDYPGWLGEILNGAINQGFLWPCHNQLEGLERGVSSIYRLVFRADQNEAS